MNNYYLCFGNSNNSVNRMPERDLNPPDYPEPEKKEVKVPFTMKLNVPAEDFFYWQDVIKSIDFDLSAVPSQLHIDKDDVEGEIYDACDYLNLLEEGIVKVEGEIVVTYDYFVKHGKYEDDEEEFYDNPEVTINFKEIKLWEEDTVTR